MENSRKSPNDEDLEMIDEETANEPFDDDVFNDEEKPGRGLTKKLERQFSVVKDLEMIDEGTDNDSAEANKVSANDSAEANKVSANDSVEADEVSANDPAEASQGNTGTYETKKLERKSSSLALVQFTQSISAINSLVVGARVNQAKNAFLRKLSSHRRELTPADYESEGRREWERISACLILTLTLGDADFSDLKPPEDTEDTTPG